MNDNSLIPRGVFVNSTEDFRLTLPGKQKQLGERFLEKQMSEQKRFRWSQFSIRGILLATLLVATFYSGRLSHQLEMKRAQTKGVFPIQSGKVKYINLGTSSNLRPGQVFNIFDMPRPSSESDIPDSNATPGGR